MAYTILVVDDSETIRGVLKRTIEMTKLPIHEVHTACNGLEALEVMEQEWIDIVFSDINMPKMTGLELVDAMKEHMEYADIPVAIISTEGSKTRIEALREKGICGYVRKPFTPEQIREVILSTLGEWHESTNG